MNRERKHSQQATRTLLLWSALASMTVAALESDRQQPIRITADSAVRQEQTNVTQYNGNVVLTQGSLIITAEQLRVNQSDPSDTLITATGAPATLQQTPKQDSTPVVANANRIVYRQTKELVQLIDNARIEQQGAIITGASIDYSITEQRVRANSSPNAGNTGQRVEVIIPASMINNGAVDDAANDATTNTSATDDTPVGEVGDFTASGNSPTARNRGTQ